MQFIVGLEMSAALGWGLALVGLVAGYMAYGWQGVLTAVTMTVFWLLLQFSRSIRVMRGAAGRPVGLVNSAVMLQSKLHAGMPMLKIVTLTRSLGTKVADKPETYRWHDVGGDAVLVELDNGRCARWTLERGTVTTAEPAP